MATTAVAGLRVPFSSTTDLRGSTAGRRIASLDIVRGAVMVLMALDHVRVFISGAGVEPTDLDRTTVPLFLTRWVTHFCAPAFVFLMGTGAYLHGERLADPRALARFLLTRGTWLVVVELTLMRFGWTFNFDYAHYLLGGVIWMIGWCMILLAALVRLPVAAVGAFGVAIIAGHNVLDRLLPRWLPAIEGSAWEAIWRVGYLGGGVQLGPGGPILFVLFALVPWIGVAAAGYAFGTVLRMPAERRRRVCVGLGIGAILAFALLRGFNLYGNAAPWQPQRFPAFTALSVINTQKYPASLLFLLMTLGPTIAILPFLENARGVVARVLAVFGRVPFFYYVLHIPLIHLAAVLLSLARYGHVLPWLTGNQPVFVPPPPPGYGYGLLTVYVVTAAIVALLYIPCRWFAELKSRRRDWWLSFL